MIGGTVHVNEYIIIEWAATNEGEVFDGTLYEVKTTGRDQAGRPFDWVFTISHVPSNPAHLVATIMAEIGERLEARARD